MQLRRFSWIWIVLIASVIVGLLAGACVPLAPVAQQSKPTNANVSSIPSVVTYWSGRQRIYAFVIGSDHHLHMHYWDGTKWQWADQGTP